MSSFVSSSRVGALLVLVMAWAPMGLLAQEVPNDSAAARRERAMSATETNANDGHIHADAVRARAANSDPLLLCMADLAGDPKFSDIADKLPLADPNHITFAMLADQSLPTPKERKKIAEWFDEREDCWKSSESLHRQQWPPELFQLAKEAGDSAREIGVKLYNRKISYGTANKQIQELRNSVSARTVPIVKQYQAEIAQQKASAQAKADDDRKAVEQSAKLREQAAEQRAMQEQQYANAQARQAEALRLQRAQIFLSYMHATQVPPPRPTYNTNCYTSGNYTNCTTH
jgi:hypothetical protein